MGILKFTLMVGELYDYVIPIMAAHLFCFYFGILADNTVLLLMPTGIQGFLYDIGTSIIAFMFVFNPERILHNINNWLHALLSASLRDGA
ncbi:hypothetical protein QUF72_04160 [Desulfobacterales bacterium HSG2]|nr:hypothetical protein [Desulfobacterales bacterium HSG2]